MIDIKVAIMSMQRIRNYGSFLQSYALKRIIETVLDQGENVEFVDYRTRSESATSNMVKKITSRLAAGETLRIQLSHLAYIRRFDAEYFRLLGLGEKRYMDSVQADCLVIGSDEVFNCTQDFGLAPDLFGQCRGVKKTISFSASFGFTTRQRLEYFGLTKSVAEMIEQNFDALSVRDWNSYQIIHKLTGRKPEIHLDPVLLYGFQNPSEIPAIKIYEKYLLVYGYFGRFTKAECREIREYARSRNLKVYCLLGRQRVCDRYILCDPFSVLAYFQNAEAVITDTYHGSIFSIICKKPFASLVRAGSSGLTNQEKLSDLLERLNIRNSQLEACTVEKICRVLSQKQDYDAVGRVIEDYRRKAYAYLQESIGDPDAATP